MANQPKAGLDYFPMDVGFSARQEGKTPQGGVWCQKCCSGAFDVEQNL